MFRLAICAFLEPQVDGTVFGAGQIPLHVTVLGNFGFDGGEVAIVAAMEAVAELLPVHVEVGGDALFGVDEDVPVVLVNPGSGIEELHSAILDEVVQLGIRVDEPLYTRAGFRPHITRVDGRAPAGGALIVLDSISLLDLAPEGDKSLRRIITTVRRLPPYGTSAPARPGADVPHGGKRRRG